MSTVLTLSSGDVMIRDRFQVQVNADGNIATLYGRVDLSDYNDLPQSRGLMVKHVRASIRDRSDTLLTNTGNFNYFSNTDLSITTDSYISSATKLWVTTRAYSNGEEVGIASPDVLYTKETTLLGSFNGANSQNFVGNLYTEENLGDFAPHGFPIISDLLVGIAMDKYDTFDDEYIEVDFFAIVSPKKFTQKQVLEMTSQQTDL